MENQFDFERSVIKSSNSIPVMIEISSPGCGPCVWMEKTLIDVTRSMNGKIEFVSISLMDHPEIAKEYNIQANPTTLLFKDGIEVARLKGALPAIVVTQWINDHI